MFEMGEVVCHKNLKFNDNNYDQKNNRPCVVLFSIQRVDRYLICTAPLTSSVKQFNKRPSRYCLIPEVIYNYKKLNFVNLENIAFHSDHDTISANIHIDKDEVYKIIERFKRYKPYTKKLKDMNNEIINYITYIELFDKLAEREANKEEKQMKILKRRQAKKGITA